MRNTARDVGRRAYLWTRAPLSPVRHCTLTGTVQGTLLHCLWDLSLTAQSVGHSLHSVVLSSAHTPTQKAHILMRVSQARWVSTSFLNSIQDIDMTTATSSKAGQKIKLICECKWKSATCTTCFCYLIQKDFNFDRLTKEQTESDNQREQILVLLLVTSEHLEITQHFPMPEEWIFSNNECHSGACSAITWGKC